MLTKEFEAELMARIDPNLADRPHTYSGELAILFGEINRLRHELNNANCMLENVKYYLEKSIECYETLANEIKSR